MVAWGHWILPSRQHLRGVSQAANHIRSWLSAGPNCPTPPQEPAFQDYFYKPHRYRPLLTKPGHGALKKVPHQVWADGEGRTSCCRAIKCICASRQPLHKEHSSHLLCRGESHQGPTPVSHTFLSITSQAFRLPNPPYPTATSFPGAYQPSALSTCSQASPFPL